MHGPGNVKFVNAQQAKQNDQYKYIKEKVYMTNDAIRYNKTCRQKQLTPRHMSIKKWQQPTVSQTTKTATQYRRVPL